MVLMLGFAEGWVDFIYNCVSIVSYSLIINGEVGDKFSPRRGASSGGPLSPYLFLIYSKGLSSLMCMASLDCLVEGTKICRVTLVVSHLLFANDCILFGGL